MLVVTISPDRARLLAAFKAGHHISASSKGPWLVFTLARRADEPGRQVRWKVSDAALASLVTKFRHDARAAYGGGDGFAVLVTLLDEELATFDGDQGEVVILGDRGLTVQAC